MTAEVRTDHDAAVPVEVVPMQGGPTAAVVDENRARAAAGITMALGAVAFVYSAFDKRFLPIRIVTALFAVDFLIRLTVGLERSPTGIVAGLLTHRNVAQWVSLKPKRFA